MFAKFSMGMEGCQGKEMSNGKMCYRSGLDASAKPGQVKRG